MNFQLVRNFDEIYFRVLLIFARVCARLANKMKPLVLT